MLSFGISIKYIFFKNIIKRVCHKIQGGVSDGQTLYKGVRMCYFIFLYFDVLMFDYEKIHIFARYHYRPLTSLGMVKLTVPIYPGATSYSLNTMTISPASLK